MVILHPKALWLFVLVPILIIVSLIRVRTRGKQATAREEHNRERIGILPALALYLSIISLIAGLAGPSFQQNSKEKNFSGVDVGIVLDISRSMLAEDSSPTRLGRAKQICVELIEIFGARYSLTLFKGDAVNLVPLTDDKFALQDGLKISFPSILSAPGTNISKALEKSVLGQVSRDGAKKVLLLLSDGERPVKEMEELPAFPYPVYVVGLGTESGTAVRLGEEVYLTDSSGDIIISARDSGFLTQIARKSGGEYMEGNDPSVSHRLAEIFRGLSPEIAVPPAVSVSAAAGDAVQKDNFRVFVLVSLFFLSLHIIFKVVKWHDI